MRRRKRSRWPCRMSSSGANIVVSKYQIVQESDNEDFILPADKAPSRSVLEKTQYNENINSLLLDRQSYVRCESNPIKRLTGEINATLFGMEKSGAISSIDRGMARAQDAALARFHGLPNVHTHKEGAALRPMVSLKDTANFVLAKRLLRRLNFLTSEHLEHHSQLVKEILGVS